MRRARASMKRRMRSMPGRVPDAPGTAVHPGARTGGEDARPQRNRYASGPCASGCTRICAAHDPVYIPGLAVRAGRRSRRKYVAGARRGAVRKARGTAGDDHRKSTERSLGEVERRAGDAAAVEGLVRAPLHAGLRGGERPSLLERHGDRLLLPAADAYRDHGEGSQHDDEEQRRDEREAADADRAAAHGTAAAPGCSDPGARHGEFTTCTSFKSCTDSPLSVIWMVNVASALRCAVPAEYVKPQAEMFEATSAELAPAALSAAAVVGSALWIA